MRPVRPVERPRNGRPRIEGPCPSSRWRIARRVLPAVLPALVPLFLLLLSTTAYAAWQPDPVQTATNVLSVADPSAAPASGAQTALRILIVMTALSLLPAVVLTMTCFTRIIIVFSFLRQALGVQGMPPTQVMTGMALFLTVFVMAPVGKRIHEEAITPLMSEAIPAQVALSRAKAPLAEFMLAHTRPEDLRLFYDVADAPRPKRRSEVDFFVLVPAYTLSEVKTAFQMGFLILVPFLVVDLVVASILMAMGMVMLPPALVSLPVKVMLFVLADGWGMVIGSLVRSLS